MKPVPNNQNALIVGAPGAGKHLIATQRIIDNLVDGRAVVVLDVGRSHASLAKALGGTHIAVHTADNHTLQQYGSMPLTVFDLEDVTSPVSFEQIHLPALSGNTFVLVDEAYQVTQRVTDLWEQLKAAMARGVPVCAVLQHLTDAAPWDRNGITIQTVKNHTLLTEGEWPPNQLCRHQDGGIYRFLFTSKHTDGLSELVAYEHVWPFEPGVKWSRPAAEWPSRFTPIAVSELVEAQKTDRATAQAAVAQAKAARRAAAK